MSTRPDPFAQLMRSGRAATIILIVLLAFFYVAMWATKSVPLVTNLGFVGDWTKPWTVLVYPLASSGDGNFFFWQLLLLFWLYWIGGDLERELGPTKVFSMFWIASVIGALSVYLATQITHTLTPLTGCLIPIGALTVAWGVRNPNACVRLWSVLPITGKWIAIIEVGIVLFAVGNYSVLAGFMALIPLGLAALFAMNKLPGLPYIRASRRESKVAKATERRKQTYYDDVYRRSKEREEQEKLRKLLESSLDDDK